MLSNGERKATPMFGSFIALDQNLTISTMNLSLDLAESTGNWKQFVMLTGREQYNTLLFQVNLRILKIF